MTTERKSNREILALITTKTKELDEKYKNRNPDLSLLAYAASCFAAILDNQEDRLQKLEKDAAEPFARR